MGFFVAESVTVPSVKVVYSEPEALQLGYQVSAPVPPTMFAPPARHQRLEKNRGRARGHKALRLAGWRHAGTNDTAERAAPPEPASSRCRARGRKEGGGGWHPPARCTPWVVW